MAVVLESAADVVGLFQVQAEVVELGERNGVDDFPGAAGIEAYLPAAIGTLQDIIGIGRVDPHRLMVAMDIGPDRLEGAAPVGRFVEAAGERIDHVRVPGVDPDVGVVERPEVDVPVAVYRFPGAAPVLGAPELPLAGGLGYDVYHVGIGPVDRHADPVHVSLGKSPAVSLSGKPGPGLSSVHRLVEAGGPAARSEVPGPALVTVGSHPNHVGVVRIDVHVAAPGQVVQIKDLAPGFPAVGGLEEPPVRVGSPGPAQGAHEHHVRITGIDPDPGDLFGVLQSDLLPCSPRVDRLVDPVTDAGRIAGIALSGSQIEDVGVGRSDGEVADRGVVLIVEQGFEGHSAVGGLEQPARRCPHVVHRAVTRDSHDGGDPARLVGGADRAPGKVLDGSQLGGIGEGDRSGRRPPGLGRQRSGDGGGEGKQDDQAAHSESPVRGAPAILPRNRGGRQQAPPVQAERARSRALRVSTRAR